MTPRTKEQNEEIRLRRLAQIRTVAADVFLNKGPLLEIRDVAAQAGLGYGTVYHYYSNKGDLLHDLLWDALVRAGGWLESPRALSLEAAVAGENNGLAVAANSGNLVAADSRQSSRDATAAAELSPIAVAFVRLLQLWAEDPALFLLCKQAGEGFTSLPEARSNSLTAAYRQEVLAPLAALLESGRTAEAPAVSGGNAAEPLQHAEMLLAALVGCASISLRRGRLHEEARNIVRFLKL